MALQLPLGALRGSYPMAGSWGLVSLHPDLPVGTCDRFKYTPTITVDDHAWVDAGAADAVQVEGADPAELTMTGRAVAFEVSGPAPIAARAASGVTMPPGRVALCCRTYARRRL